MRQLYKINPMQSLRKWFYKPRRDDRSLLAQFFFADEHLNMVAAELDSFDGRKDPERCSTLVNQLRLAQDRVLNITSQIMDQLLGDERVARGFRVKFPEDVLQDNLAGQLWFGAECLAAGSSIMNREQQSTVMRPLARALTRSLETVRGLLREHCLRPRPQLNDDMLLESLKIFDRLFAEFELCYVSAMVTVKTPIEFEAQQLICVLFSETLNRALNTGLLTQDQVDDYDPALMFAIPRLALVTGLLVYSTGPLSIEKPSDQMSEMFRPFRKLLHRIRELLWTLDVRELRTLERLLCTNEDISNITAMPAEETIGKSIVDQTVCHCSYQFSLSNGSSGAIADSDYLPENIEVTTPLVEGMRRLDCIDEQNTFHEEPDRETRSRKTSRNESDLSTLRNLSTSALMMFDPLVINTINNNETLNNVTLPNQELVSCLNEQVTEIADKLSSIKNNPDITIQDGVHSYTDCDITSYSKELLDDIESTASTSHGYLIPNAISHEPVVLSSLSQNNSAVFSQDELIGQNFIVPDQSDVDVMNASMTLATENLNSILNEGVIETVTDDDKVKFVVGYESDAHEDSQTDSGVCTETTSLDRSPDEINRDKKSKHYIDKNNVLNDSKNDNSLENSFRSENPVSSVVIGNNGEDVTVDISYTDNSNGIVKNEAASNVNNSLVNTGDISLGVNVINDAVTEMPHSSGQGASGDCREPRSGVKRKRKKKGPKIWSPGRVILENRSSYDQRPPMKLNLDHFVDDGYPSVEYWSVPMDECASDEQIAMVLQAQELAAREQARAKFKSSEDLIHRLFICIAGVADQLQTNFAADLRNILKSVFLMNQTPELPVETDQPSNDEKKISSLEYEATEDQVIQNGSSFDSVYSAEEVYADSSDSSNSDNVCRRSESEHPTCSSTVADIERRMTDGKEDYTESEDTLTYNSIAVNQRDGASDGSERAPDWVPDVAAPDCMRCGAHFTAFRRRHHCRNCGKVFCASCSNSSIPLPRYGQMKPVRVCTDCRYIILYHT